MTHPENNLEGYHPPISYPAILVISNIYANYIIKYVLYYKQINFCFENQNYYKLLENDIIWI